jgi:dTDP-4-dehydrorhamnose 3,5-epimerase
MEIPQLKFQPVYKDERGVFSPVSLININDLDLDKRWVQVNTSISEHKYTLRGMHYQIDPFKQCKYLTVIKGKILDFVVQTNHLKSDFGKIYLFEVGENHAVIVPRGYAHGILTLEPNTVVQYLVDNKYSPENEFSVKWDTVPGLTEMFQNYIPDFNPKNITISEKDRDGHSYQELEKEVVF